jgi:hypothetical protein
MKQDDMCEALSAVPDGITNSINGLLILVKKNKYSSEALFLEPRILWYNFYYFFFFGGTGV